MCDIAEKKTKHIYRNIWHNMRKFDNKIFHIAAFVKKSCKIENNNNIVFSWKKGMFLNTKNVYYTEYIL